MTEIKGPLVVEQNLYRLFKSLRTAGWSDDLNGNLVFTGKENKPDFVPESEESRKFCTISVDKDGMQVLIDPVVSRLQPDEALAKVTAWWNDLIKTVNATNQQERKPILKEKVELISGSPTSTIHIKLGFTENKTS